MDPSQENASKPDADMIAAAEMPQTEDGPGGDDRVEEAAAAATDAPEETADGTEVDGAPASAGESPAAESVDAQTDAQEGATTTAADAQAPEPDAEADVDVDAESDAKVEAEAEAEPYAEVEAADGGDEAEASESAAAATEDVEPPRPGSSTPADDEDEDDDDEDWDDVPSAEGDVDDDLEEEDGGAADMALEKRAVDEGVSMMELLMEEGDYLPESHERGDIIMGTVIRKDEDQLILDVGAKREGIVPSSDVGRLPAGYLDTIKVGDEIEVVVMRRPARPEGDLLVSASQALTRKDWERATDYLDSGEILELTLVGYNKGGGLAGFGALQGFIPKSHLVSLSRFADDSPVSERLARLVGENVPVKVIEVNRRQRRLIMSERRAVREWRATQKEELLDDLNEGEVRTGRVSSIADFGVFVDLGGADGLVHVSELTYERGKHPRDIVAVGDEVDVYVLSLDRDRKRIGLSMKRLQQDPWSTVEEEHYVGQIVDAQITNLTKFGAFARLPSGLEGLIHISELSDEHVEHPREVVRPNQKVAVEIISIDAERQRIGLSLRRVPEHLRLPDEGPEAEEQVDADEAADSDGAETDEAAELAVTETDEADTAVSGAGSDAAEEPSADAETAVSEAGSDATEESSAESETVVEAVETVETEEGSDGQVKADEADKDDGDDDVDDDDDDDDDEEDEDVPNGDDVDDDHDQEDDDGDDDGDDQEDADDDGDGDDQEDEVVDDVEAQDNAEEVAQVDDEDDDEEGA